VLNLRTLAPLPVDDVLQAVHDHPATIFVDEARGPGSTASYLMARVLEHEPSRVARLVCSRQAPSPFAEDLLDEVVPTADRIAHEAAAATRRE
jgi:pyruvate/2-oxoglutarate/acetoin dehydrogenase E1 component